jgi:uncharacterized membrane protein YtjA (UPF0391 family)
MTGCVRSRQSIFGVTPIIDASAGDLAQLRKSPSVSGTTFRENLMFNWAVIFLIIGIVAGILGLSGIAGTATNIAWTLFVVGLVVFLVFGLFGRRAPLV